METLKSLLSFPGRSPCLRPQKTTTVLLREQQKELLTIRTEPDSEPRSFLLEGGFSRLDAAVAGDRAPDKVLRKENTGGVEQIAQLQAIYRIIIARSCKPQFPLKSLEEGKRLGSRARVPAAPRAKGAGGRTAQGHPP